jgi:DNA primase
VTAAGQDRIDVAALRAAHPIEKVIAASGVELHPRGHSYIGCCPFHEDTTPSLSVGGVPERFKCFGCGAAGEVIEFVTRLHHLSFVDAVHAREACPSSPSDERCRTAPNSPGLFGYARSTSNP